MKYVYKVYPKQAPVVDAVSLTSRRHNRPLLGFYELRPLNNPNHESRFAMNTYRTLHPILDQVGRLPVDWAKMDLSSPSGPTARIIKRLTDDNFVQVKTSFERTLQKPEYGGTLNDAKCGIRKILIEPLNAVSQDRYTRLSMEQPFTLDRQRCLTRQTPIVYLKQAYENSPELVMKVSPNWFEGIWQAINEFPPHWLGRKEARFNAEFVQEHGTLNSAARGFVE
jgi:hypothetical protein